MHTKALIVLLALAAGVALGFTAIAQEATTAAEPRVLVFSKTAGFRHGSIPYGVKAMTELGREGGFVVDATEDEETHAAAGVSVAVDAAGRVRAVGKRGGGGIDLGVVRGMMKTARDVGKKLIAAVDGFLLAAGSGAGEEEDDEEDAMET